MLLENIRNYYRSVPPGIRVISFATAIRWIGWGLVNPIFPVFLFSLVGNYALASVIDSTGRFVFLLLLPLAGALADRMSLKKFLIAGLIFFVFDGLGYFAAGLTGAVAWILLANILDGFGVVSDVIGRSTYIRRYASPDRVSTMFGFSTFVNNAGYVGGIAASVFIVKVLPLPWIFFMIVPTTLVSLAIFTWGLPNETNVVPKKGTGAFWNNYVAAWRDALAWEPGVRSLAGLTLLLSMVETLGSFIIPIYAYVQGASLARVAFIGVLFNLPWLFAEPLGRIADRFREKVLPLGLLGIAASVAAFSFLGGYRAQLGLALVLETFILLTLLAVDGVVTRKVPAARFGQVSAVFEGMKDFGKFLGPLALGIAADLAGPRTLFLGTAAAAILGLFLLLGPRAASRPGEALS